MLKAVNVLAKSFQKLKLSSMHESNSDHNDEIDHISEEAGNRCEDQSLLWISLTDIGSYLNNRN